MTKVNAKVLKVGLVGAGEVAQTTHLPTLQLCSSMFKVIAICDVSEQSLEHCANKFTIPNVYTSLTSMLNGSPEIDLVMIVNATEFHARHAIKAANAKKHVFVEKPIAFTRDDAQEIQNARIRNNVVVFVGYMRRYSKAFIRLQQIIEQDCQSISYARIRDIIGLNQQFIAQSGSYPQYYQDIPLECQKDRTNLFESSLWKLRISNDDDKRISIYRQLCHHASHDISAMREIFGMPNKCTDATCSNDGNFLNCIFAYEKFNITFEMGVDHVADFDAHIEVFTPTQRLKLEYDTPYVKGLPITLNIKKFDSRTDDYTDQTLRPTYTDTYTLEYTALYNAIVNNASYKTTPKDAMDDFLIFDMIMEKLNT